MFSLIITIVSIALVVALVAATMYHGGDTLTQGRERADAAAFVGGAQQITGAASMFLALEGAAPADVDALVDADYLSSAPNAPMAVGGAWILGANTLSAEVASQEVCNRLEAIGGEAYGCVAATVADVPNGIEVGDLVFTFNY